MYDTYIVSPQGLSGGLWLLWDHDVQVTLESSNHNLIANTKNWYRKETDLWAEFGKEAPFDRKFSSKDLAKIVAVSSTPSLGRRAVCA
jgi:hypothetical protein